MSNTPFTARNAAKFVVSVAIASKTKQVAEDAITDYTSLEEDTLAVSIPSQLIGWYVADKLRPVTDAMVA
jgi:hypothetical protein